MTLPAMASSAVRSDAVHAHEEGSPQRREFQNKMKLAKWKLKELDNKAPPDRPGIAIKIVDPEDSQE
ncbi:hypothetical protein AYJ54_31795 [Bradyrhizobium centrolobii]|uniref:Uncharacterized protein n=3 Tax=Nitrobacteraceae TaxID=41294 RepID=A0A176YSR7_9BRAD|nr:hypothetical protein AYJ54_31795 [Bradyrhizobium centrolobii]OAF09769.1 hypothetical protein AXW67_26325 [Bradyrhizobium neotropicale]